MPASVLVASAHMVDHLVDAAVVSYPFKLWRWTCSAARTLSIIFNCFDGNPWHIRKYIFTTAFSICQVNNFRSSALIKIHIDVIHKVITHTHSKILIWRKDFQLISLTSKWKAWAGLTNRETVPLPKNQMCRLREVALRESPLADRVLAASSDSAPESAASICEENVSLSFRCISRLVRMSDLDLTKCQGCSPRLALSHDKLRLSPPCPSKRQSWF